MHFCVSLESFTFYLKNLFSLIFFFSFSFNLFCSIGDWIQDSYLTSKYYTTKLHPQSFFKCCWVTQTGLKLSILLPAWASQVVGIIGIYLHTCLGFVVVVIVVDVSLLMMNSPAGPCFFIMISSSNMGLAIHFLLLSCSCFCKLFHPWLVIF